MSNILIGFLYVVEVLVCLLLALVVMLQKPKEGGLGGAIAGGSLEATLGADAANVLIKTTSILGAIFLINTLMLAALTSSAKSGSVVAGEEVLPPAPVTQEAPAVPEAPAPVAPAAPAAEVPAAPAEAPAK